MLTDRDKTLIAQFPLGFVSTVRADGAPAVSPKGTFLVLSDTQIAYGDIRSPGTRRNLGADPRVEVCLADPFLRQAVRVTGTAEVLPEGTPAFDALLPRWAETWGDLAQRIRAIVRIDITRAQRILTPPYDDGVTEAEMIALYQGKYAEIYP